MKKKFNEEEDLNPKDNELDELDTDDLDEFDGSDSDYGEE